MSSTPQPDPLLPESRPFQERLRPGEEIRYRLDLARNYVKVAFRSLKRHAVVSGINLFGLSVAIGCAIMVYLFLANYLSMNDFHAHADRTYLVEHRVQRNDAMESWGRMPGAMGPEFMSGVAGVEESLRLRWGGAHILQDAGSFQETVLFSDPTFFDILTFPLAAGSEEALKRDDSVILTRRAATKYFGSSDPMGQPFSLTLGSGERLDLTVRGVAEGLPDNTGLLWSVLIPWSATSDAGVEDYDGWGFLDSRLIVRLEENADPATIAAELDRALPAQHLAREDWQIDSFFLDNIVRPAPGAYMIRNRAMEAPNPALILMMIAIPLIMLLLASFNYINIALGIAERRVREIGVRKVVGGKRRQLVLQFMTENLTLTSLATVLGGILATTVFIPGFNNVFVYTIAESPFGHPMFWVFIAAMILLVSVVSGAYPALFVSRFRPTVIFRGATAMQGSRWFSRIFLGMQFILVFVAAILSLYLTDAGRHFQNRDWGYDPEPIVVARLDPGTAFGPLRDRLMGRSEVASVASTRDHIGLSMNRTDITLDGTQRTAGMAQVGAGYFSTMGIPQKSGRLFNVQFEGDLAAAAVVNASFVQIAGFDDPLGQTFRLNDRTLEIVGVVDDVVGNPLMATLPTFYTRIDDAEASMAVIRMADGKSAPGRQVVESVMKGLYPENIPDVTRQAEIFDNNLASYARLTDSLGLLAVLALLIACTGLYGLASQGLSARIKEMGIRKVLGAGGASLAWLANRSFFGLVTMAAVVAIPLCYGAITFALSRFETAFPSAGLFPFVGSYGLIVGVAIAAVAVHTFKLVRVNPARALRSE